MNLRLLPGDICSLVYTAWVDAWLSNTAEDGDSKNENASLTLAELGELFRGPNLVRLLDHEVLQNAVRSFKRLHADGQVIMGGSKAPSCDVTDVLSESFDPVTHCACNGLFPVPEHTTTANILESVDCQSVRNTLDATEEVLGKLDEWSSGDHCSNLFSAENMRVAVSELLLANSNMLPSPDTCQGAGAMADIPAVLAPDRRPHPRNDTASIVHRELYPTAEGLKMCADAKYYFAAACGSGWCDDGILRAVADSGNDILIGDYRGAADGPSLKLLQQVGAAAFAFLKLCTIAGAVTEWQLRLLVGMTIEFRALGFYADHARSRLPEGVRGSHMTNVIAHRHIDLAIAHGIVPASLAAGQRELGEGEYMRLAEVCTLINDIVDFRSDTLRKQRENIVLRGVRGSFCEYLDALIGRVVGSSVELIRSNPLGARVIMGFCDWAVLASHHKLYEIVTGVQEVGTYPTCEYSSQKNQGSYQELLAALSSYGTLASTDIQPSVWKKRVDMDETYSVIRTQGKKHDAWLADMTRSLLDPSVLRKIADVVHFEWTGQTGDKEYCP